MLLSLYWGERHLLCLRYFPKLLMKNKITDVFGLTLLIWISEIQGHCKIWIFFLNVSDWLHKRKTSHYCWKHGNIMYNVWTQYKWILSLYLGPLQKISHCTYANIPKSRPSVYNIHFRLGEYSLPVVSFLLPLAPPCFSFCSSSQPLPYLTLLLAYDLHWRAEAQFWALVDSSLESTGPTAACAFSMLLKDSGMCKNCQKMYKQ